MKKDIGHSICEGNNMNRLFNKIDKKEGMWDSVNRSGQFVTRLTDDGYMI